MQPTTTTTASPNFSNIGNPPTVQQPTMTTSPQRIGFNRKYLLSITGILHIALIIFQFCGWVSAASVVKPGGTSLPTDIMQTRGAYLFFSIVGWLIAIFFFLICLFNLINVGFLARLPWTIITLALDGLWILPTFIVSIVAATKETQAKGLDDSSGYNFGSFAAAAFFGLVCTVFYVADTIYHVVAIIRGGGPTAPPPYTP